MCSFLTVRVCLRLWSFWAGGLRLRLYPALLVLSQGMGGGSTLQSDLTVAGCPGVYALGDFANTKGEDGKPLPQLASVAQQAGRHCADNIIAITAGKGQKPSRTLIRVSWR